MCALSAEIKEDAHLMVKRRRENGNRYSSALPFCSS